MPIQQGDTYALSIHADYRCHRSGVCCTSDWDVPIELPLYRTLENAMAEGRLRPAADAAADPRAFAAGPDLPDDAAAMVARTRSGDCVFYQRRSGLCAVQHDLGEAHLPATCRHFPRLAVRDGRGTFITLTHYCPTAASMLFRDDVPLAIVERPPAFPPGDYGGLAIIGDDWPPLLHPRMLMDFDGYTAWERHMVARCAAANISPESVVATLARDARLLRRHDPAHGAIARAVSDLPRAFVRRPPPVDLRASLELFGEVVRAVPDDMTPDADEERLPEAYLRWVAPGWDRWRQPLTRYVAAKAFASWTAYQGRGVQTIVRGLDAALAVVRVEAARQCRDAGGALDAALLREAFRSADFLLNHLAAGDALADSWATVEDASHIEDGDDRSVVARAGLTLDDA
ncbi:MAG: hypothetical protein HY824_08135 [Acidobacteria bacterium]|nr:hypothetical protein [Acidobacteriota bacterium]